MTEAIINEQINQAYPHGFVTDIDATTFEPGLNEDIIRRLSAIKNEPEFMLTWRLNAFKKWQTMTEPHWVRAHYPSIDYQAISYYSAPNSKKKTQ